MEDQSSTFNELIQSTINYDGLQRAREVGDLLNLDSKSEMNLGLMLHVSNTRARRDLADLVDDTAFSDKFTNTVRILEKLGFQLAYKTEFVGWDDKTEEFRIYASYDGVVAKVESYGGVVEGSANSCEMYFNWVTDDPKSVFTYKISGGRYSFDSKVDRLISFYNVDQADRMTKQLSTVVVGHVDSREFLSWRLKQMRQNGRFLPVWVKAPFLWFLTYMDGKTVDTGGDGSDYDTINKRRIMESPVLQRICATALDRSVELKNTLYCGGVLDISGVDFRKAAWAFFKTHPHTEHKMELQYVNPDRVDPMDLLTVPGVQLEGRPVAIVDGRPALSRRQLALVSKPSCYEATRSYLRSNRSKKQRAEIREYRRQLRRERKAL